MDTKTKQNVIALQTLAGIVFSTEIGKHDFTLGDAMAVIMDIVTAIDSLPSDTMLNGYIVANSFEKTLGEFEGSSAYDFAIDKGLISVSGEVIDAGLFSFMDIH